MVSTALYESFRTAYGFWRGVGPRGNALLSFAHELAKLPEFGDEALSGKAGIPEASPLAAAVLVLDEAWRRQYAASAVTEEALEELLSAARHEQLGRPAPGGGPQPPPEYPLFNRHAELDRVCLAQPVPAFYEPGETGFSTDKKVPAGAVGTIMLVLGKEQGYEVEFTEPFAAIATVRDADLN